jgi:hypothetical protein
LRAIVYPIYRNSSLTWKGCYFLLRHCGNKYPIDEICSPGITIENNLVNEAVNFNFPHTDERYVCKRAKQFMVARFVANGITQFRHGPV